MNKMHINLGVNIGENRNSVREQPFGKAFPVKPRRAPGNNRQLWPQYNYSKPYLVKTGRCTRGVTQGGQTRSRCRGVTEEYYRGYAAICCLPFFFFTSRSCETTRLNSYAPRGYIWRSVHSGPAPRCRLQKAK